MNLTQVSGTYQEMVTDNGVLGYKGADRALVFTPEELLNIWAAGYGKVFICYRDGSEMVYTPDCELGNLREKRS